MSKTFYQDDGAPFAEVTGHGLGAEYIATTDMPASPGGSAGLNFVIPNVSNRARIFVENDADVTRVSTGTATVHVNITATASATATMKVRLFRVNSSGAVQNTGAYTATQACSTGVKTFSPAITGLGTWVAGDRLALEVYIANDNAHGGDDTYTITVGVADATDDVIASDFLGPPAISSASMGDTGRDWDVPYQEISIVFDQAMEKSGGTPYNVGDTIPGLTIGPSGSEGAVTYRSGDSTTTWVVRRAALAHNGDTWVIDYARSTGELVKDGGGSELLETANAAITNNLTKRIRVIVKNAAGSPITTISNFIVFSITSGIRDLDGSLTGVIKNKQTPTAAGLIDVEWTGTMLVGEYVYVACFNPPEDSSGSTEATISMFWPQVVE